ncbi:YagK/YfjJ domain-containing protein [Vibrio sp. OPT18]|uniref:YagK/YfjJ domain-containing protein n=1 Tax=Vibrio sp. OPT18 TaxID=2778641 RepID=UPI00187DEF43|nr:inovirus-type Gp2 protein [Vibrio sp. OPT18]MBE8576461.1 inovirus-type Gp2 protein [Vibrio sp. OPT18]
MEDNVIESEWFREYQIDTVDGGLSLPLIEKLYFAYRSVLSRFGHCYVFRFRLGIPRKHNHQAKTLFNQWFYRFCHYRQHDKINVIWRKEVLDSGDICYRFTMFLDAAPYQPIANEYQIRKKLTKDITRTWATTTQTSQYDISDLCSFLTQPLLELNKDHEDFDYQHRCLFYALSRQASITMNHDVDAQSTIGSFVSKSKKKGRQPRKPREKRSKKRQPSSARPRAQA